MLFSSIPFLFFFMPLVLAAYFVVPKKFKNFTLLIFSLVFYAWGEPIYIILMIFSSVVDYCNGRMIEKFEGNKKMQKVFLIASIVINVSLLGFFKYADFLVGNINLLLGTSIPLTNLPLPIGISFFTFQTMSYSIDVFRKDVKAEHSFINFMTYVSMFPQLIAGPIVRYSTIAEELNNRTVTAEGFNDGVRRFVVGLGKKVLIANSAGLLWTSIQATQNPTSVVSFLGILAFAFQIFFDFAGYSDMAIGMGRMFGFTFPENFNYPYTAKSISDFWRRWHMSLSTWFKDYVYFPLGGSRRKPFRNNMNLLIVWMITGFWHGSAWNFILWGLYFGVILIIEKNFLLKPLQKAPVFVQRLYALTLILFGWVIFAFDSMPALGSFLSSLFGANGFFSPQAIFYLRNFSLVLIVAAIFSTPVAKNIRTHFENKGGTAFKVYSALSAISLCAVLFFCVAYLVDASYNPFLYFRF